MDAHRKHRGEHERNIREHEPRAAHDHDQDFREFDEADQPSLVMIVGKLPGKSGEKEEREDEQRLRDRAELKLFGRVLEQLIGDEQNDRLLEQAVVEGAEELGRKQRNEPPRAQQVGNVLDQSLGAQGFMDLGEA